MPANDPKKALQQDLRNILKKVSAGRPLARHERDLLAMNAGDGQSVQRWAHNQVELSRVLGITRQTLGNWLRIKGNPGRKPNGLYDVSAWQAFAMNREIDQSADTKALRKQALELQNRRAAVELGILQGDYVKAELVEAWGGELGANIRKIVTQLRKLAPQLAGLTVPEIEARLREEEVNIMAQLHGLDAHIQGMKKEIA